MRFAIALLLAIVVVPTNAVELLNRPTAGIQGLLSTPDILGGDAGVCANGNASTLPIHDAPNADANPIGRVLVSPATREPDGGCRIGSVLFDPAPRDDPPDTPVPMLEHGYEAASLIVLDARPPWFRVALGQAGDGWLHSEHGHYRTLVDLYRDGLTYLTDTWDGELCDGPDPERACAIADAARLHHEQQDAVTVTASAEIAGETWIEVELITSPCRTDSQYTLPIRGWLRARDSAGRPNVWFHARGC